MGIHEQRVSLDRLNLKFEKRGCIMKSKYTRFAIFFILLASLPFYAGCESDILAGSVALSVIKGADGIVPNGKDVATIEAAVTDADGGPVGLGMPVDFETTEGFFSNRKKSITKYTTDVSGTTRAHLRVRDSSKADLDVVLNKAYISVWAQDDSAFTEIDIIACPPGNDPAAMTASVTPDTIPADKTTTATITATMTDCEGEPVVGEIMEFRTTKGLFSNGKMVILKETKDITGTASAFLVVQEGAPLGPISIKITSKSVPKVFTIVTLLVGARPASVVLVASPTSIIPDGRDFSTLTATVTDFQGVPVPPGTAVNFETIVGRFSNGSTSITVTTTSSGTAIVHFFAEVGTSPQLVQITAISMGVSARAVVEIKAPEATPTPTPTPTS